MSETMRRLDIKPRKKLRNPDRHLRALKRWADGFEGFFPAEAQRRDQRFLNWKIPIHSKLVSEAHTTPAILRTCILRLVDAAAHLQAAKPADCASMPVAALIRYPNLFDAEVTVFVDPEYFYSFNPDHFRPRSVQSGAFRVDSEPSRVDVVGEHQIRLPPGARAGGCLLREIDMDAPESPRAYENWTIGFW